MDKIRLPQYPDQECARKLAELRQAIQEGIDSGVSGRTVEQIWAKAEAKYRARHL